MEISKKTDYALRMLAELVNNPGGIVSVRTAAKENGVPYSFARSIQHDLALAGLVENTRGAAGGMRLAIDPAQTTLLEVIEAVQGPAIISACGLVVGDGPCPYAKNCHYSPVWCVAERLLHEYFSSVTLREVVVDGVVPQFEGKFVLTHNTEERDRLLAQALERVRERLADA